MIDGIHYKVKELTVTTLNGQFRFSNVDVVKHKASLDIEIENGYVSFPLQNIVIYRYELEAK